jgi:hypothetical protein
VVFTPGKIGKLIGAEHLELKYPAIHQSSHSDLLEADIIEAFLSS